MNNDFIYVKILALFMLMLFIGISMTVSLAAAIIWVGIIGITTTCLAWVLNNAP